MEQVGERLAENLGREAEEQGRCRGEDYEHYNEKRWLYTRHTIDKY